MTLILHVFDFDGTLFGSPTYPTDWPAHKGPGRWWTYPASLSEPCVPEVPSKDWWNTEIVALAKQSIADPNILCVLMTGRPNSNAAIRYRVAELLHQAGLNFDAVYLKTTNDTESFKVSQIKKILAQHPVISEAHFWDDRHHHLSSFENAADFYGVEGVGHPVERFQKIANCNYQDILDLKESKMSSMIKESEEIRRPMSMDLPEDLIAIHNVIKRYGDLFVVGGAVRDTLLNKTPKDYDLATDLTPDRVIEVLSNLNFKIDLTGKDFGVVRVWTDEGNEYEIATFREDIGSGRRPDEVRWASIEDDVKRRDLTVNALFYDIDEKEIVDLVGGIEDIKNRVIRAVGNPIERFNEDPLRVLRAIRFAARMGSRLDQETEDAVTQVAKSGLKGVSPDRIQDEFVKGILTAVDPLEYIDWAVELSVTDQIFPGLRVLGPESGISLGGSIEVQIATMLSANDPSATLKTLKRMRFKNSVGDIVSFLIRLSSIDINNVVNLKKEYIKFGKKYKLSSQDVIDFSNNSPSSSLSPSDARKFVSFAESPPASSAKDLMAQGIKGGELGKALDKAEVEAYLNTTDNMSEAFLRNVLKQMISSRK